MTLSTHALAALLFAMLAVVGWRDRTGGTLPRRALAAALALTALWALAVAGIGGRDVATRLAEGVRTIAWTMVALAIARGAGRVPRALVAVAGAGVAVACLAMAGSIAVAAAPSRDLATTLLTAQLIARMLGALALLIVVHGVHLRLTRDDQGAARLVLACVAALAAADLVLFATSWATMATPRVLLDVRGAMLVVAAPLIALALNRDRDWTPQVSRTVAHQVALALGISGWAVAMIAATAAIGGIAGDHARLAQTAFVFGSTAAILTIAATPWTRAWAKVVVAKHFFRHRYDYRAEWMRFTDTLSGAVALEARVVKAVADLVDAPAGWLLVADGDALVPAGSWRADVASGEGAQRLLDHLAVTRRIVELDAVRGGRAPAEERACVPDWLIADPAAWAIVPLLHLGGLVGAVVLMRPPMTRALDWEDFDLLGVAGRQAASYLAEARAHAALADARRFDEFNRRFAFIMHDLKNLVSQLSLTARNAERHADNPAFRADMVATLTESSARMTYLLSRLSERGAALAEAPRPVAVRAIADGVARALGAHHPVAVTGEARDLALADPVALETLLRHLVQNAIDASAADARVTIALAGDAGAVRIAVEDHGHGMTPAFVRERLFRPFASDKPGGFGLGAFEARQLAEAMGGRLTVDSRAGEGTRFELVLPAAPREMEKAA